MVLLKTDGRNCISLLCHRSPTFRRISLVISLPLRLSKLCMELLDISFIAHS
jgi:hypothetical protein